MLVIPLLLNSTVATVATFFEPRDSDTKKPERVRLGKTSPLGYFFFLKATI